MSRTLNKILLCAAAMGGLVAQAKGPTIPIYENFELDGPQRLEFTKDNKFPRWQQLEIGAAYRYKQTGDSSDPMDPRPEVELNEVAVYGRYGLTPQLVVYADIPLAFNQVEIGDDESGLGDITLGLELIAYKDFFDEVYIVPWIEYELSIADSEDLLGNGENLLLPGITFGKVIYNSWLFAADVAYRVWEDRDNQLQLGLSVLYEVDKNLAFQVEGRYLNDTGFFEDDDQVSILAGMTFNWSAALQMGVNFGAAVSGPDEDFVNVRFSYMF